MDLDDSPNGYKTGRAPAHHGSGLIAHLKKAWTWMADPVECAIKPLNDRYTMYTSKHCSLPFIYCSDGAPLSVVGGRSGPRSFRLNVQRRHSPSGQ